MKNEADICIVCEGSYPYFFGGVAQWVHELITEHKERTFHVLTLMPPHPDLTIRYKFPKNVIGHTVYIIQYLPEGAHALHPPDNIWDAIGYTLKGLVSTKTFDDFELILTLFRKHQKHLGKQILSESMDAWKAFINLYDEVIPYGPFKSYFGTVYTLSRSLFSILLPELPKAKIFHAVCTGYAGFILYRAKKEIGVPCLITEHGIYSNERRIEIAMADWITDVGSLDLALEDKKKTLKDFWLNAFFSMAHACYISCDEIFSTFDGNRDIQIESGADPAKVRTIVHGIESGGKQLDRKKHPPTVAFVGRAVPIKDVKTFIRACHIVKQQLPEVRFFALGSIEEDKDYYAECKKLVDGLGLSDFLKFSGQVNLKEYFPEIDVIALTSISEAQPLVMLEAGAFGIPSVATNVGACEQLLYGGKEESPNLGQGGIVTPLVDPEATAAAILRLLTDHEFYQQCSETIKKRIQTYYVFQQEHDEYRKIYEKHLSSTLDKEVSWQA